jgi:fructokinase
MAARMLRNASGAITLKSTGEHSVIVVCGEALMDVFAAGETATGLMLDARVGGSPFNVAVALARMKQPVAFLSAVSTGFLGDRLMAALQAEGVNTSAVARTAAPTTLSLVGLDAQGVPAYSFYGHGAADRQLHVADLAALTPLAQQVQAMHVGSYATVVEPMASTLRALVEREHQRCLIAYDPNLRLNVDPNLDAWRNTVAWTLSRTHLLKISDEDLGLLQPGVAPADFAAHALSRGVTWVIVTQGGDGAQAWCAHGHVQVPSPHVGVIDTVGAGDTFQAALLTWLSEHQALSASAMAALDLAALEQALRFAAAAAAITCSRRGADMPRRTELSTPA